MPNRVLRLFMWGFQPHFRTRLEGQAKRALEALGLTVEPRALLVGVRKPGSTDPNPVCLEPEDGEWSLSQFAGVPTAIETIYSAHPGHRMRFTDELTTLEQPERLRRESVGIAVSEALGRDVGSGTRYFCGSARLVGEFYVVPVVAVPEHALAACPGLDSGTSPGASGLIQATVACVLHEASAELERPDPGRSLTEPRGAREVVREAASTFARNIGARLGTRWSADLFERLNVISSMFYERAAGTGAMVLCRDRHPDVEYALRFAEPVPLDEPRWARKALQMATSDVALVADCSHIRGLGRLSPGHDASKHDVFVVDFLEHYHWQMRCGSQVLLRSRYGEPSLPGDALPRDRFVDNFLRLFRTAQLADASRQWDIFKAAIALPHGVSIIVAEDAAAEAARLAGQGARVEPVPLSPELLARVSGIDGSVLLDPTGSCHAIGVILDGLARPECSPARGSRYNSAVRYTGEASAARLAIVVSDDRSVDVLPLLRPRIRRDAFESAIATLETATLDNYHQPRMWLDEHRFYADERDCERINLALDRIERLPRDVGEFVIVTPRFRPAAEMGPDYWESATE